MIITWYGHAAFGISGINNFGIAVRIVLDPYNYPGCGGYLPIDEAADVVSISHDNPRYHSDTSAIRGDFELLAGLEYTGSTRESHGVRFAAHEVYETPDREGPNAMVRFTLEDVTVAHLGDLGHALDDAAIKFLGGCDVLLALTGGPPTLELSDLRTIVEKVRPAAVVPMHFKTPKVNLTILPIEATLEAFAEFPIRHTDSAQIEVSPSTLPDETTLYILESAR